MHCSRQRRLFNDRAHAATGVEQQDDRKRQLILAKVSDLLLYIFFEDLEVIFTKWPENFARLLVDDLRVENDQVGVYSDNFIGIDFLRGEDCVTNAKRERREGAKNGCGSYSSWQVSFARRELRFKRLAAVIGALNQSGLIHPERQLAGLAVTQRFSVGDITLAVFADRNTEVVAAEFRVDHIGAEHSALISAGKSPYCPPCCWL